MDTKRITRSRRWFAGCMLLAACAPALAHPLHGAGDGLAAGFAHPFLGLDHLLAMVALGVWAAQLGGRWLWAMPVVFVTAMLAGGVLGFAGFALPLTEPLVAASVLVLGLLIALPARLPWPGVALAAAFAVFHGLAHAGELPAGSTAAAYAAGFAAGTAALHAAGIGLGMRIRSGALAARLAGVPIAIAGCWLVAASIA